MIKYREWSDKKLRVGDKLFCKESNYHYVYSGKE